MRVETHVRIVCTVLLLALAGCVGPRVVECRLARSSETAGYVRVVAMDSEAVRYIGREVVLSSRHIRCVELREEAGVSSFVMFLTARGQRILQELYDTVPPDTQVVVLIEGQMLGVEAEQGQSDLDEGTIELRPALSTDEISRLAETLKARRRAADESVGVRE